MLKQYFLILVISIWMGAYAQGTDNQPDDSDEETDPKDLRRIILETPCRPCFTMDVLGRCRHVFGCTRKNTNETLPENESEYTEDIDDPNSSNNNSTSSNNENSGPMDSTLPAEIHDSLCLPCFEADRFLRCRKIPGCVVTTTNAPEETSPKNASDSDNTNYTTDSTGSSNKKVISEKETVTNQSTQPAGNSTKGDMESQTELYNSSSSTTKDTGSLPTPGNFSDSVSTSTSTVFISDVPLIKTFSPGFTRPTTVTQAPNKTPVKTTSGPKEEISNATVTNGNISVTLTTDASTTKQRLVPTEDIWKTTASFSSSNDPVTTTQITTTTTTDPCQTGALAQNIWCYFKSLWKLSI